MQIVHRTHGLDRFGWVKTDSHDGTAYGMALAYTVTKPHKIARAAWERRGFDSVSPFLSGKPP